MLQKCRECHELKTKQFLTIMPRKYGADKRYTNAKYCTRTVYSDCLGRQWNGNQCPDCKYRGKDEK